MLTLESKYIGFERSRIRKDHCHLLMLRVKMAQLLRWMFLILHYRCESFQNHPPANHTEKQNMKTINKKLMPYDTLCIKNNRVINHESCTFLNMWRNDVSQLEITFLFYLSKVAYIWLFLTQPRLGLLNFMRVMESS